MEEPQGLDPDRRQGLGDPCFRGRNKNPNPAHFYYCSACLKSIIIVISIMNTGTAGQGLLGGL